MRIASLPRLTNPPHGVRRMTCGWFHEAEMDVFCSTNRTAAVFWVRKAWNCTRNGTLLPCKQCKALAGKDIQYMLVQLAAVSMYTLTGGNFKKNTQLFQFQWLKSRLTDGFLCFHYTSQHRPIHGSFNIPVLDNPLTPSLPWISSPLVQATLGKSLGSNTTLTTHLYCS